MTKAIIFDCDGVLVDSEIIGLSETTEFLREFGFQWSEADLISNLTGYRMERVADALHAEYARILGRSITAEETQVLFQGMIDCRRANRHKLKEVPGALEMIRTVRDLRSVAVAVASSSQTDYLEGKLQRTGLWDHLTPHIYSADRVESGKPAPDIFLYTAEKINMAPEDCLVIEDSTHGVMAGLAAGMDVWGFTGGGHCFEGHGERLADAGASQVIGSHQLLLQHFRAKFT